MKTIWKGVIGILLALSIGQLVGCTAMIHNMVVSDYPTFDATEKSWPIIPENHGRVVVYWPRLPAGGFNPNPFGGGGGFDILKLTIDGDKSKSSTVGDQTFVFVDLSAGNHTFEFDSCPLCKKQTSTVDVRTGETIFLKIRKTFTANDLPILVDSADARDSLKDIHHNYKIALPFNQQPKGSRPAL